MTEASNLRFILQNNIACNFHYLPEQHALHLQVTVRYCQIANWEKKVFI